MATQITVSHDEIVADYQRRLAALTHENVMLGLVLQQTRERLDNAETSLSLLEGDRAAIADEPPSKT